MRTRAAALQTLLESTTTRAPMVVQFKRRDGQAAVGITNWAVDIQADLGLGDGVVTFRAVPGFNPSQIEFTQGFQGSSTQLQTAITNRIDSTPVFDENEVRAGFWRDARVTSAVMHSRATGLTPMIMNTYKTGRMTLNGIELEIELLSLGQNFDQSPILINQETCGHEFGGNFPTNRSCGFIIDPISWVASQAIIKREPGVSSSGSSVSPVDGVPAPVFNNRQYWGETTGTAGASPPTFLTTIDSTFTDGTGSWRVKRATTAILEIATVVNNFTFTTTPSIDSPDDWFSNGGTLKFTSGNLTPHGKFDIESFTNSTQTWVLKREIAQDIFPPQVGDDLKAFAVCNHSNDLTTGHCVIRHENYRLFGGFPRTPLLTDTRGAVKGS